MALNPSNGSNLEHLALKGLNQSFVVHFWGHFSVRRRALQLAGDTSLRCSYLTDPGCASALNGNSKATCNHAEVTRCFFTAVYHSGCVYPVGMMLGCGG